MRAESRSARADNGAGGRIEVVPIPIKDAGGALASPRQHQIAWCPVNHELTGEAQPAEPTLPLPVCSPRVGARLVGGSSLGHDRRLRQGEAEGAALAWLALDPHPPAV